MTVGTALLIIAAIAWLLAALKTSRPGALSVCMVLCFGLALDGATDYWHVLFAGWMTLAGCMIGCGIALGRRIGAAVASIGVLDFGNNALIWAIYALAKVDRPTFEMLPLHMDMSVTISYAANILLTVIAIAAYFGKKPQTGGGSSTGDRYEHHFVDDSSAHGGSSMAGGSFSAIEERARSSDRGRQSDSEGGPVAAP